MEQFENFIVGNDDKISCGEAKDRNGLVFAFVGDAVYSLFVRGFLASQSTAKAGVLHGLATKFVRASFQCELLDILWECFDEQEKQVATNARNAKTNNIAKNSNLVEYKKSTAFEAILGHLYLTGKNERLLQVLELCKEQICKKLLA